MRERAPGLLCEQSPLPKEVCLEQAVDRLDALRRRLVHHCLPLLHYVELVPRLPLHAAFCFSVHIQCMPLHSISGLGIAQLQMCWAFLDVVRMPIIGCCAHGLLAGTSLLQADTVEGLVGILKDTLCSWC